MKAALPDIGPIWQTGARSAIGCICVAAYALVTKRRVFDHRWDRGRGRARGASLHRRIHRALRLAPLHHRGAGDRIHLRRAVFCRAWRARLLAGRAAEAQSVAWPRARLRRRRDRPCEARAGRRLCRRRVGAARRGALGGDDPRHHRHPAPARRSRQDASLPDRRRGARLAARRRPAFGEKAPTHLSALGLFAVLWQGVVVVGASYIAWFWLLKTYPAPQLSAFTFVTPAGRRLRRVDRIRRDR